MTLPYSPSRAVYQGNGAATAFPFAFKVWSTDQLSVSVTSPDGFTSCGAGLDGKPWRMRRHADLSARGRAVACGLAAGHRARHALCPEHRPCFGLAL